MLTVVEKVLSLSISELEKRVETLERNPVPEVSTKKVFHAYASKAVGVATPIVLTVIKNEIGLPVSLPKISPGFYAIGNSGLEFIPEKNISITKFTNMLGTPLTVTFFYGQDEGELLSVYLRELVSGNMVDASFSNVEIYFECNLIPSIPD